MQPDSEAHAVPAARALELAPFRALRYRMPEQRLGAVLCPPYDVVDEAERARLLAADAHNAVALILPRTADGTDAYGHARELLTGWTADGVLGADDAAALYVYEMRTADGAATRGLLGAVTLADAADGVILPHENTMAGPVADRLALMEATEADLEPIYLVYDGGGPASQVVADADGAEPIAQATTPDGTRHRLWALPDPATHAAVARDLAGRRALIADGHHRYATYRERQRRRRAQHGPGPWDRGLALLVDSSAYGPQVHPIHRVLPGVALDDALAALAPHATLADIDPRTADATVGAADAFAVALTDGSRAVLVTDLDPTLAEEALRPGEPPELARLDVTIVHRVLAERLWALPDTVDAIGYAHSAAEAVALAAQTGGTAVLLRATPVAAVAAVAAAGARMPRKSTLFTPKPASGLVMRRFADEPDGVPG